MTRAHRSMNLARFIETFQEAITRAVLRTYPPLYSARNLHDRGFDLRRLRRRPLVADSLTSHAGDLAQFRQRAESHAHLSAMVVPIGRGELLAAKID